MIFNWFKMRDRIIAGEYPNESDYIIEEPDSKVVHGVEFIIIDGIKLTWTQYHKKVKIRCHCGGLKDSYDHSCYKCYALWHKRVFPEAVV